MRTWVGYKQIGVPYEREERHAGDSKYSFSKLITLASNGIFNFSEFPIKFIARLGLITTMISLIYLGYAVAKLILKDTVPEGFIGVIFTVTLFGGIQLLSLGVIGEYVLRIFFQVKDRPLFIIKKQIRNGQTIL